MANDATVGIAEARDLPSIGTLHARAFHPRNEWHRKVFPSSLAPWWEEKYALDLDNPDCHLLKVSSPEAPATVLGLLCLRRFTADERGAGRWTSFRAPPQTDREAFDAALGAMVKYREQFMLGRPHFNIDHFGVDDDYQGQGLGMKLMARMGEIADREGLDVFVEANEFAESFYNRCGFTTQERVEMPGGMKECFLIRRFKAS